MRPGDRDPNCPHCHGAGIYWETINGLPFAVFCACTTPTPLVNQPGALT